MSYENKDILELFNGDKTTFIYRRLKDGKAVVSDEKIEDSDHTLVWETKIKYMEELERGVHDKEVLGKKFDQITEKVMKPIKDYFEDLPKRCERIKKEILGKKE